MMRPTLAPAQSPHNTPWTLRMQSHMVIMSMVVNHSSDLMCVQRPYLIHKQLNSLSTNIHGTVDIITHSTQEPVTCHRLRIFCCRPSCCFIAAAGAGWQMEENSCKYFPNTVNNSLAKYPALRRRCSHKPRFASSIRDPAQSSPAQPQPTPRVHILRLN